MHFEKNNNVEVIKMYEKELRLDKDSEGIEEDLSKTVSQGANENLNSSETKTQAESQTEQ